MMTIGIEIMCHLKQLRMRREICHEDSLEAFCLEIQRRQSLLESTREITPRPMLLAAITTEFLEFCSAPAPLDEEQLACASAHLVEHSVDFLDLFCLKLGYAHTGTSLLPRDC